MASIVIPAGSESRRARWLQAHSLTPVIGVLVVAILCFFAWKVLDLASSSDQARSDQIGFAAIQAEIEVQHGLEWQAFATHVTPEIAAEVQDSQTAIAAHLVVLEKTAVEDGSPMRHLVADVERVTHMVDREFAAMAAGDRAAAEKIDEEETDPTFAEISRHLEVLSATEAEESRQALSRLRTGTVLGLGGVGAAIVALLILLVSLTRKGAKREAKSLDELRQSQKMDAVGQLAGGVAHDFNNLLTAILGYSELALFRLGEDADPELRVEIEEIAKSGERAAALTRQLLALSRRQTLQSTVFNLNDAVSATEGLLTRLLGTNISIATTLDPRECLVHADHGQIEQVVMNLAINARDAMPQGGVLRIETDAVVLSAADAKRRFHAPAGEYVILRVADNGCGMEASTLQHAFEPFYTTKALGEGTGLGLATVYGIVGQSGGYIALDSEPGDGTVFELLLPRMAGVASPAEPTPSPAAGGNERILLVEDEEVVRQLTRDLLSREGYDVVVAAEGEEALELAREQRFDLVITDMVMPKLSGKIVAARLLGEQPHLPIIFISGYAHDILGEGLGASEAFLQKPFSAQELSLAVRTSLDRSTARAA